ncbi:MATE family efflux transporter [Dorea longicatena]|uniref:MATE family efflux transporter n=1 Tax=Dorea longicatena TaxID=88431 RepID=UPI0015A0AD34|nr:MATE family efflux transporter [Dorea longicatena]MCB5930005.1 MATE family efflux transporter [Agathobacter rectalis]MCQ4893721.1 MATE family efflux transporter [Dorea longicatena]
MNEQTKTTMMTEGSVVKNILFFSVPLILGNLLQQLYNTVDSIIVGNYVGSNALAAIGSSTSLVYLLIAFSQGVSVGAGVVISQRLGQKNKEGVQTSVHTALALAVILGIILTVGGILFSKEILLWMNTPEEVLTDAVTYLRLYSAGMVFNVVYNMAAGILNAAGNSKRSLGYLAIASVTNLILDLVFIVGMKTGIAGAAIATNIGQIVSCVLAIWFLVRTQTDYKVCLSKIKIHKATAGLIIKIGLPTGFQNMVISLSNILVQSSVNSFGANAMAGFGAYMKVDGFNVLPVTSFGMAATTFVGQNFGAGKLERVKRGMWITLGIGMIYTITTGILLLTFSETIMHLFSNDAAVIDYGQQAMRFFCPFYWVLSILHALSGTVRGTGKSIPPMIVLLISLCLFRVLWVQFVMPDIASIEGIFMLYPISWTIGSGLMILYTWKGKWLTYYEKRR